MSAEFLAVDVETNGLAGEDCELTEVGAVLVGGGELHDEWESLVRVSRALSPGIQRFTGITQAMVEAAAGPGPVLAALAGRLTGRVLVAHNASFDRGALRLAFERCGLQWPDPPVLCTVALARRFAPLAGRRGLAPLAEALGVEVDGTHRALVDARSCARVFCALFPKLCANASTVAEAVALLAPRRPRVSGRAVRRRPEARPDLSKLPDDPGVYIFRDDRGRPLYVGKSVSLRARARSHFCAPAGWTERAEIVDYRPTNSELGALVLENRLIKAWRPPGNVKLKRSDRYVYLRCRLDIPYPVLEVDPEPAAGHAVNIGPLRGRALARELADQLNSLFRLRHCGRGLPRRDHPSAYGQMGRCLSPCLQDLDPNLYRRQLDAALRLFEGPGTGGELLLEHIRAEMRTAAAELRFERAATLRRRHERLSGLLERLGGVLRATHADPRILLARHPEKERFDVFWVVQGRVVDWGGLAPGRELAERSRAALRRVPPKRAQPLPAEQVDEVRIVSAWCASHEPPALALAGAEQDEDLEEWLGAARSRPPTAAPA